MYSSKNRIFLKTSFTSREQKFLLAWNFTSATVLQQINWRCSFVRHCQSIGLGKFVSIKIECNINVSNIYVKPWRNMRARMLSLHACRFDVVESVICSFIPTFIVPDTRDTRSKFRSMLEHATRMRGAKDTEQSMMNRWSIILPILRRFSFEQNEFSRQISRKIEKSIIFQHPVLNPY